MMTVAYFFAVVALICIGLGINKEYTEMMAKYEKVLDRHAQRRR